MLGQIGSVNTFTIFGPAHGAAILALILLGGWLLATGRRRGPDSPWVRRTCVILGAVQLLNLAAWHIWTFARGAWNVTEALPLQLCDIAVFVSAIALFRRQALAFELTYLWCLAGTFQGLITPNILEPFPHFRFWQYFILHGGLVVTALFLAVCCRLRPRRGTLFRVWLASNLMALVALVANVLLDANYMFLCEPPPTGSLLDFLGPWPWYIAGEEILAAVFFAILLLPFRRSTA